ncbi:MAG: peptide MFS transporter [Bacteroidota bacterium]
MSTTSTQSVENGPQTFGHPSGLFYLFFAELWERFSFYGMRALLTLYMVNNLFRELSNGEEISIGIYAAYGALVYATPVIGGNMADRFLGYRKSIMLGAVLMALGHFIMAFESEFFFFGALGLLIVGNGFFKPNISTMVGSLYPPGDKRRDAGFTIFYMGINAGAFLAPLVCGWLGETYGWHWGFGAAGVGMLIGLVVFALGSRNGIFLDVGLQPEKWQKEKVFGTNVANVIYFGAALLVPIASFLVYFNDLHIPGLGELMEALLIAVGIIILGYLIYYMSRSEKVVWQRLFVVLVLTVFITVFWSFFEQAGSSLTLFAERNVNLTFLNASQTNAINPFYIIVLAVPFSLLWTFLDTKRLNPSTPIKFALGILQLGLGFGVFAFSAHQMDSTGSVPFFYLAAGYFLITTGEMFISPIGLSKVTELSPKAIVSLMMGVWFLSSAFAHHISGVIAKLTVEEATTEYVEKSGVINGFVEAFTGEDQNKVGRFNFDFQKALVAVLDTSWINQSKIKDGEGNVTGMDYSKLELPSGEDLNQLIGATQAMATVNDKWAEAAPGNVKLAEELKPMAAALSYTDTLNPNRPKEYFFEFYDQFFAFENSPTQKDAQKLLAMDEGAEKTEKLEKFGQVAAKAQAMEKVKVFNATKDKMVQYNAEWANNAFAFAKKYSAFKKSVGKVKGLSNYVKVFSQITFFALFFALIAMLLSPILKRMMHGIK